MTSPATETNALVVQYKDGAGVWVDFAPAQDLGTLVRTRRLARGPRLDVTAREWRLVKKAGHDWGTAKFNLDAIAFRQETATLSAVRIRQFSFDDKAQRYFLVQTDGNLEVYYGDHRIASIPSPHTDAQIVLVRRAQVLDTLLTFHQDVAPHRITRQGAHAQWDSRPLAFDSLPVFDYVGDRAGGVNDVQQITFTDYLTGETFNLTLEGEVTASIAYSSVGATLVANIKAALEALGNVGPGNVTVTNPAANTIRVEFVGDCRAQDVGEMAGRTLVSAQGLVIVATLTQGVEGGEPIISASRGWAACGAFYQGRLYLAGLKSRPQTVIASRVGQWFQFKSSGSLKAISVDLDTDETTTIAAIFPGQHLQLFTSSAEFYFPLEPITPPPAVKRPTRRGIAEGGPVAELAGATIFLTAGGGALAEFLFDDTRATYTAAFVSKWATHLLAGTRKAPTHIVDMGFRRARTPTECDRAILVRADGDAAIMHALREDEVTGFVRWTTQGLFLAAEADLAGDEYVAVRRTLAAGDEILIEKVDPAQMLDAAVKTPGPVATVSAPHLAGMTVAVYMDGGDAGDVTADAAGDIALPQPALREVDVGLLHVPRLVTLPPVLENDPRGGADLNARPVNLNLELGPTANLAAGIKGAKMFRVPLTRRPDGALDVGPGEAPFEGWTLLTPLMGFSGEGQIEIVQPRPGPFELKQIVVSIET